MKAQLPSMVCFRVTRFCNARCGFCLAPPDGGRHPSFESLKHRIDWLFDNGVKTIHFCGGEPTIHHDLAKLISYVRERRKSSRLTTNGIAISDELIQALRESETEVKVSLHGPREHHNDVVGTDAFDKAVSNLQRMVRFRVRTSVQTTIVTGHLDVIDWSTGFCLGNGIRRVSFLPFIPRGKGYEHNSRYALSPAERVKMQIAVRQQRRKLNSRLDVRLLDFNSRPIHVVEPDGRVVLERATEARDVLLYSIDEHLRS